MQDHDTLTAAASNTRLVGFHDLQGRESLQVTLEGGTTMHRFGSFVQRGPEVEP